MNMNCTIDDPILDIDHDQIEVVRNAIIRLGVDDAAVFIDDELMSLIGDNKDEWRANIEQLYTLEALNIRITPLLTISFMSKVERYIKRIDDNIHKLIKNKRDYARRSNKRLLSLSDTKEVLSALEEYDAILEDCISNPLKIDTEKILRFMEHRGVLGELVKKIKNFKWSKPYARALRIYAFVCGITKTDEFKDYLKEKLEKVPISKRGWSNQELRSVSIRMVKLLKRTEHKKKAVRAINLATKSDMTMDDRAVLLRALSILRVATKLHRNALLSTAKAITTAVPHGVVSVDID